MKSEIKANFQTFKGRQKTFNFFSFYFPGRKITRNFEVLIFRWPKNWKFYHAEFCRDSDQCNFGLWLVCKLYEYMVTIQSGISQCMKIRRFKISQKIRFYLIYLWFPKIILNIFFKHCEIGKWVVSKNDLWVAVKIETSTFVAFGYGLIRGCVIVGGWSFLPPKPKGSDKKVDLTTELQFSDPLREDPFCLESLLWSKLRTEKSSHDVLSQSEADCCNKTKTQSLIVNSKKSKDSKTKNKI